MSNRIERGSALLVAVLVVVIISVMSIGMIRVGTLATASAVANAKREALAQCAEAGASLLLSKFHILGTATPAEIEALNVPLDGPLGRTLVIGGHFDSSNVQLGQIVTLPERAAGPAAKVDEGGNTATTPDGKKSAYKVVVHCQDNGTPGDPTSGRQLEVELGIRFGM